MDKTPPLILYAGFAVLFAVVVITGRAIYHGESAPEAGLPSRLEWEFVEAQGGPNILRTPTPRGWLVLGASDDGLTIHIDDPEHEWLDRD